MLVLGQLVTIFVFLWIMIEIIRVCTADSFLLSPLLLKFCSN